VQRSNGAVGWASAKYLDPLGDGMVIEPPTSTDLVVQTRLTYTCGSFGRLRFVIYKGGDKADVIFGGKTYRVLRRDHLVMRYFYVGPNWVRLRGSSRLIEWRWLDGRRVDCTAS
jgi:hypothetical protein